MSINSLANAAVARRPETVPLGTVPKGLDEIAKASATPPATAEQPQVTGAPPEKPPSAIDTASNVLFGYIPTEVLTLYVAVLAAIHQPGVTVSGGPGVWRAFVCFLCATPVVVWLVYAAKVKALKQSLPLSLGTWPMWEMTAAIIAYCAWALALPDSPFAQFKWYSSALSGVIVLVASTLLGLLAPFFQRPLKV